jgi:hypothetical protein
VFLLGGGGSVLLLVIVTVSVGILCKISLSVYSYYVDMHIDISSTKFDERDYHEYEGSSYKCSD